MTDRVTEITKETLITAASTFRPDQIGAYEKAIAAETDETARWAMESILENARVAADTRGPLCDDTGIPHVILEVGPGSTITGELLESVREGVRQGLRELPGRPMAVMGDDVQRLEQSAGLSVNPDDMVLAPIMVIDSEEEGIRLNVLMEGGGPEIRSKTYRVFHKHSIDVVKKEIISWASDEVGNLGCTPCTLAVGIGRTHYEASSLMLQAMIRGRFDRQNEIETEITDEINRLRVGPLGLGGDTTVLATFLKVGPQRASGVRIVSIRPCCCFEPRTASAQL